MRTRIFVKDKLFSQQTLLLSKEQSHYLLNVLRMKAGDNCRVFNGQDGQWQATLQVNDKKPFFSITEQLLPQKDESILHFAFSPIKQCSAAEIVTKATELGATHIHPLLMERSVINSINLDKLEQAAIHAAEQCERLSVPQVTPISKLNIFLQSNEFSPLVFFHEKPSKPMEDNNNYIKPCILIGPEGGFSSKEVDIIRQYPFLKEINLGSRILKAETAVVASLAVYNTLANNW